MRTLKNILLLFGFLVNLTVYSQGPTCAQSACLPSGSYPTTSGSPSSGSCGCLGSTPNPMWISIYISTSGPLHWILTQTNTAGNLIDVDFSLFGPFTSQTNGCPVNCSASIDCSFSGSATEYIDINSAVAGQYYNLLVTNYNGAQGTVSIVAAPGTTLPVSSGCSPTVTTTSTPAMCGQPSGSVTATASSSSGNMFSYSWNIPGNPTTATVNNVAPGTYTVTVTPLPSGTPSTSTVTVGNLNSTFTATNTPSSCPLGHDGTATANFAVPGGNAGVTATYAWNDPAGQTTQTATGLLPGAYSCTVTLSNGCVGTVNTTVGANAVSYSGTTTLVSCPGGSDGTGSVTMTPVVGTLSYAWNDPAAQTTQTATGLSAGAYSCVITSNIGCTGTVNLTVTEIPGMIGSIANQTAVTCNSGSDGMVNVSVSQGTPIYSYAWDNSTSTQNVAADLPAGNHVVTVTDAKGCVITINSTVTEPNPLAITSLTPNSILCPEDSLMLTAVGSGGSGGPATYIFTWTENGVNIGTGSSIYVNPENTNTVYCVTLSEVCGSPTTDSCLTLTFPEKIVPQFQSDKAYSCIPGDFTFFNLSNNIAEIDSMVVSYGDDIMDTIYGGQNLTHTYTYAGMFTIDVDVYSIQGCLTKGKFENIGVVIANPVAQFNMSANPTTIFETNITMQNNSSAGTINWWWSAPGASPSLSTLKNPTFHYPEGVEAQYDIELIVETAEGCRDTVSKRLTVNPDILFYAPNSFTPDGDEFNQTWGFYVTGVDEFNFELLIFDRYGEIVWETHDIHSSWDGTYHGKPLPMGSYSWVARVKTLNDDSKKEFNGAINILK